MTVTETAGSGLDEFAGETEEVKTLTEAEIQERFDALKDVTKGMVLELRKYITEHNEIQTRLIASTVDRTALIKDLTKDSNDPEIKELQAQIEEIEDRITELLSAQADQIIASASTTVDADKARIKEVNVAIRGGMQFVNSLNPGLNVGIFLPDIKGKGVKAGGTGAGRGEGGRKIKNLDVYVDGELATLLDAKKQPRSSLSAAGKVLGIPVIKIQEALFEAAGTDKPADFPASLEFQVADKDKTSHTVRVEKRS